ncbi:MAG: pyridoxamine 5'-phosphate oxidase family protein, partial [Dehalococcoidia bacterium]
MSDLYHEGHRQLQDHFDTRRLADRLDGIVHDTITESDREFIERMPMFFLATVDARGHANCSYKGGEPGFVRAVDERTLAFPSFDGNGMFL